MVGSALMLIVLLVVLLVHQFPTNILVIFALTANVRVESAMLRLSIGIAADPITPLATVRNPLLILIVPVPRALTLVMLLLQITVPPLIVSVPEAAPEAALWLAREMPPEPTVNLPLAPTVMVPLACAKVVVPEETAITILLA